MTLPFAVRNLLAMPYEFKSLRRVEFSETDMAGIVHFSSFFCYMESTEHAFYRSLGFSVVPDQFTPPLGFPRVHASCDYRRPLRFEDTLEIRLFVKEKRSRVLNYFFHFHKVAAGSEMMSPVLVATGALTVVCVTHQPGAKMHAVPIPSAIADLIQVAPPELLTIQ